MPKQRLTCTRCSQRRQKCDRKTPCSRCVQNKEGHLCTTQWSDNYNPSVHRRYPRKTSAVAPSPVVSSDTSSTLNGTPPAALQGQFATGVIGLAELAAASSATDPVTGLGFVIGQSRFLDMTIGSILDEKDAPAPNSNLFDQSLKYVRSAGKQIDVPNREVSFCSPIARAVEAQHVVSLLPNKETVLTITDYYYENMLYWVGGIYHGPSFRQKLVDAYGSSTTFDLQNLDWKWMGLLFAILASGTIASPEVLSVSWGYSTDDKVRLSREWGTAAVSCLNMGNYMSQYNICSVQAVYVLHSYEHLVGSTNQWVGLRSVALMIAKGLGLHKLAPHPDDAKVPELNAHQKQAFIDREIGRRTWVMMATQEWLCSTTQNSHTGTIQKGTFTTALPMHLDEDTMLPIDDGAPRATLVGKYLYDYSIMLLDFHNTMLGATDADDATRYATILKYDAELRAIGVEKVPKVFSPHTPLDPAWPKWTKWARTLHQASINHKIIMLHQSFINKSFKDVRYTYTRWACCTAAKTVISLYTTREPNEPQWWVEQAFIVTSSICLMLDIFHRPADDAEAEEYQACVRSAVRYLQLFETSSVALHGVRLLLSLLQEYGKVHEGTRGQAASGPATVQVAQPVCSTHEYVATAQEMEETAQLNFDLDTMGFGDLMDYLPMEGGFDGNVFFDSMCGLATGQMPL